MAKKGKILIALIVLHFVFGTTYGSASHQINFHKVNNPGLPRNISVYDIEELNNGLICFATSKGLYTFDGRFFIQANSNEKKLKPCLIDLYIDKKEQLWALDDSGSLWKFDNFNNIESITNNQKVRPLAESLHQLGDSIGFFDQQLREHLFYEQKKVNTNKPDPLALYASINYGIEDPLLRKLHFYLEMNLENIISHYEFKPGKVFTYREKNKVHLIYGNVNFVSSEKGIKYDFLKNHLTFYEKYENYIFSISKMQKLRIKQNKKTCIAQWPKGLKLNTLFIDKNGGIWLATEKDGTYYNANISAVEYPFSQYNINKKATFEITNNNAILVVSGDVFQLIDIKTGQTTHKYKLAQPIQNLFLEKDITKRLDHIKGSSKETNLSTYKDNKLIYAFGNKQFFQFKNNKFIPNNTIHKKDSNYKALFGKKVIQIKKDAIFLSLNGKVMDSLPFLLAINHVEKGNYNLWISTNYGIVRIFIQANKLHANQYLYSSGLTGANVHKIREFKNTLFVLLYDKIISLPIESLKSRKLSNTISFSTNGEVSLVNTNEYVIRCSTATTIRFITETTPIQQFSKLGYSFNEIKKPNVQKTLKNNSIHLFVKKSQFGIQVNNDFSAKPDPITIHVKDKAYATIHEWIQIGFGSMAFIAIVLILLLRIRIEKRKAGFEKAQTMQMQNILLQQMNPHFIFNSLTSINHFILQNKPMESSRYLTSFSNLIRNILEYSSKKEITIHEEVENLTMYLNLEKLRFKDRFTYTIDVNPLLDPHRLLLPPFIVQPFIEQALRDGVISKPEAGIIKVSFREVNNRLQCIIVDNGVRKQNETTSVHMHRMHNKNTGISIAKQRIHLHNKTNIKKISVEQNDITSHDNSIHGRHTILLFPLKNKQI